MNMHLMSWEIIIAAFFALPYKTS